MKIGYNLRTKTLKITNLFKTDNGSKNYFKLDKIIQIINYKYCELIWVLPNLFKIDRVNLIMLTKLRIIIFLLRVLK